MGNGRSGGKSEHMVHIRASAADPRPWLIRDAFRIDGMMLTGYARCECD